MDLSFLSASSSLMPLSFLVSDIIEASFKPSFDHGFSFLNEMFFENRFRFRVDFLVLVGVDDIVPLDLGDFRYRYVPIDIDYC